jgi:hypothetical protein
MEKSWRQKQSSEYFVNKGNISDLIQMCGTQRDSRYKMTFTYVSLADKDDINVTHTYIIMCPFVTGQEKLWKEDKTKVCDQSYVLGMYSDNNPYLYMRDDYMYVPVEFYKHMHMHNKDIYIMKYEGGYLREPEYVIVGNKPVLYSIELSNANLRRKTFEEWFEGCEAGRKAVLKFQSPLQGKLPFPAADIELVLKGGRTFFEVNRINM